MVVDAIDKAAALYGHFGFHGLDGHRPWRRLGDDAGALGVDPWGRRGRSSACAGIGRALDRISLAQGGIHLREDPEKV